MDRAGKEFAFVRLGGQRVLSVIGQVASRLDVIGWPGGPDGQVSFKLGTATRE
jgi:hypothetical protein